MTYAPGTWTARGLTVSTNYGGGKSHKVADARQPLFTPECQHANARLIAAAPDLLETLEYVLLAADYDGALTMGTAALSPAIRDRIVRTLAKVHGEETAE